MAGSAVRVLGTALGTALADGYTPVLHPWGNTGRGRLRHGDRAQAPEQRRPISLAGSLKSGVPVSVRRSALLLITASVLLTACDDPPNRETTAPPPPGADKVVPLWGVFEATLTNSREYADPFNETELLATFTAPSGKEYSFFGFYDGDGAGGQEGPIWRIRFMCLEEGAWTWSAEFTDGAPGAGGEFECLGDGVTPPLRVHPTNPRWLVREGAGPFLPRWFYLHDLLFTPGDTWRQDVREHLIDRGYNMVSILTTQADHLLENGWNRRRYDRRRFYPWLREGERVLWNRYDLRSWRKLDEVLRHLQEHGIYVYLFDGFFPNIPPRFPDDPELERRYLRYAMARIGAYSNLIHNLTFEFWEFMSLDRVKRIGSYLESIDPFGLLTTVHDTQDAGELLDESWLDLANLQYDAGRAAGADLAYRFVTEHYRGKPVAATEVVWEGAHKLTADQVRRGAWGITLAGGFFLYGEFDLDGEGIGPHGKGGAHDDLAILYDFMASVPFTEMVPSPDLVSPGALCLADPGREYIVYLENGGPVEVDLTGAEGTLRAEWLDPRSGARTAIAAEIPGGGIRRFEKPAGADWVLHIYR